TIRKWIMRQYEDQKEKVKQRIQSAKSRIHISCDLWTSPNSLANLGIVAHYVTEDGQLEHHVLALKDIDSEHDGSHLAVAVLNVVDEWGFASKLGYFVMDNAGNNDTMMRSLSLGQHNDSLFLLTGGPNILQASYADMTSNTTSEMRLTAISTNGWNQIALETSSLQRTGSSWRRLSPSWRS
ncbi:hypothetical protein BFJ66_g18515, partial [Fusarium oxysporum f. sp. cepae]